MKKILSLFFLLFSFISVSQEIRISGTVYDKETREKLIGAQIYEFYSGKGAVTNEFGYFSLKIPRRDTIKLGVSYLGYRTGILYLSGHYSLELTIELTPGEDLEQVTISINKQKPVEKDVEVGKITMKAPQIENVPVIFSEPDLIKAIQKLPGVQGGIEGTGGMFVRGGSIDQNLFLLDDVPLYYVNHLGGFISVFNTDAISNVTLYKAGFPARYGNRLSSVLDIRTRDGHKKEYHGSFMLGILSWKFNLEGPLVKDKTSFILSVRRFPYDLLTRLLTISSGEGSMGYTFYDLNAKINHQFSDRDQIYLSWYYGDDAYSVSYNEPGIKEKTRIAWGNHLISFKWAHSFYNGIFMNNTLAYTRYRFGITYKEEEQNPSYKTHIGYYSGIMDYRFRSDWEYHINNQVTIKGGIGYVNHTFKPGITNFYEKDGGTERDTVIGKYIFHSHDLHGFLSGDMQLTSRLAIQPGVRINYYLTGKKAFPSFEPRINVRYLTGEQASVKISYMRVNQNIHLLTSGGLGTPVDLWMPATAMVPPSAGWQVSAGYYRSLMDGSYDFSLETYYKELTNQIDYKPGTSFFSFSFNNWEYLVEKNGFGQSYGVEFLLRKKRGRATGSLAYSWAKSIRHFRFINNGKPYPFRYDRRHSLDLTIAYQVKKGMDFSVAWTFGSGYPFSLPVGRVDVSDQRYAYTVYIYKEKNNFRMRPYHRLDVNLRFTKKKTKGTRIINLGIYNLYNRQNPVFYDLAWTEDGIKILQYSLFPIIPSISYMYKF